MHIMINCIPYLKTFLMESNEFNELIKNHPDTNNAEFLGFIGKIVSFGRNM